METFGDKIYEIILNNKNLLFLQGEMAQLTYISFEQTVNWIENEQREIIPISYPIGFYPDKTPMMSIPREYSKEELKERYGFLGLSKLPIDGIFQLVTITETILNDVLRTIMIEYPKKIPNKKKLDVEDVLNCDSIEQIKLHLVDNILNEIAYKSPKEYAEEFKHYTSVNLLENPVYHNYIELKATRDIHIHNKGIANEIYQLKAGVLSRVKNGIYLPVTLQYFLEMYEQCLQLTEVLTKELDSIWPSLVYRNRRTTNPEQSQEEAIEKTINEIKENERSLENETL